MPGRGGGGALATLRTEYAGENNDCFAMMRLQFKIVGARSGPAPALPLCLSHGLDAALNSTEEMRFP